jgi:predicted phosphodiesterase
MLFGIIGDLHLRKTNPERRTDNFFESQLAKLEYCLKYCSDLGIKYLFQPGDFTDAYDVSRGVDFYTATLLKKYRDVRVFTTLGQHDMNFRSMKYLDRTVMGCLNASEVLTLCLGKVDVDENLSVYGHSYEKELSKEESANIAREMTGKLKVFLGHVSVGTADLYPGQNIASPKTVCRDFPGFDLYVLGDYHFRFQDMYKNVHIVNAGVLSRKTKKEAHQEPGMFIYDSTLNKIELIKIPCIPFEECFDLSCVEESEPSDILRRLVSALRDKRDDVDSASDSYKFMLEKALALSVLSPSEIQRAIDEYSSIVIGDT